MSKVGPTPRPTVDAFARRMETELRANDHKGGWDGCAPHWLLARACEEFAELLDTIQGGKPAQLQLLLAHHHLRLAGHCLYQIGHYTELSAKPTLGAEAADVANFLMMAVDVLSSKKQADDPERGATSEELYGKAPK